MSIYRNFKRELRLWTLAWQNWRVRIGPARLPYSEQIARGEAIGHAKEWGLCEMTREVLSARARPSALTLWSTDSPGTLEKPGEAMVHWSDLQRAIAEFVGPEVDRPCPRRRLHLCKLTP